MNVQRTLVNVETCSVISSFKTINTCVISSAVKTLKTFSTIMAAEATLVSIGACPIVVFFETIFTFTLETIFFLLACHRLIVYAAELKIGWGPLRMLNAEPRGGG